jgi:protoporphyrinogen oxidase
MNIKQYDIIIIGAGLAGLYSAYNIKQMYPKTNLLVLESNKRPYIGGRIGNDFF